LRKQRGWTLVDASQRTGLSVASLSKVENNKIALGYDSLVKLGMGYRIDLSLLLAPQLVPVDGAADWAFAPRDGGRKHITPFYDQEYPFSELLHRRMLPIFTRVKARNIEDFGKLIGHPGEEFLLVLEGVVDLHREGREPVRMRAGDSMYFNATVGHASVSVGIGEALQISVVTAPPHYLNHEEL
jgi:transcriptional regulator with XRE-family HTH domain